MLNKQSDDPFTTWDVKVIQIFKVFSGVALEKARHFGEQADIAHQLRSFFNISFSMRANQSTQKMLEVIMLEARQSIGAERTSIFLVDDSTNTLSTFVADGGQMRPTQRLSIGIAAQSARTKEGLLANDAYNSPYFNRALDSQTGFKTTGLLAAPILSANGTVFGVVEMVNKTQGEFVPRDLQLLTTFAQFASAALEHNRLKDIAHLGDVEIEGAKWVAENERQQYEIPVNSKLTKAETDEIYSLSCLAVSYKGICHFKEVFHLFYDFHILEQFQITNERFFRIIFNTSARYNDVPYHNWTHACDVLQHIALQLNLAKLDQTLTALEIIGLLVVAVCHDTNHEGLNNAYNLKAETPSGIHFKDMSVMEMHHITQSIPIITDDKVCLFGALEPDDAKQMWYFFINLILATDMAKHFDLLKEASSMMDGCDWDITNPIHRLLAMKLVLKTSAISNVSRSFAIADKWCDILCDEFFRQGDLEKKSGIGLTSSLNNRDHIEKTKSQIGFYNFICLPLYQLVSRIFPPLTVLLESINTNLDIWKEKI
jgi:hypothetical protein